MTSLSVVVNCYAEGYKLYDALDSLQNQTDKDFKTYIVNDFSSDDLTNSICKEIETKEIAEVIWNKSNLGHGLSRNVAFDIITTDAVVFLDADDTIPENAISLIREAFNNHPDADFVFGNYILFQIQQERKSIIDCSILTDENRVLIPKKLALDWKLLGTSPCKKSLWEKIEGYDTEFSNTTNDVDFWQRAILANAKGYFINDVIYVYNQSQNGLNLSVKFINALKYCNYKNFNFILFYNSNYKDALNIALQFNDYVKIKQWATFQSSTMRRKTILVYLFLFTPIQILPLITSLFLYFRKCKKKLKPN